MADDIAVGYRDESVSAGGADDDLLIEREEEAGDKDGGERQGEGDGAEVAEPACGAAC